MRDSTFRTRPALRREDLRYRCTVTRADDAYLRAGVAGAYLPPIMLEVPHLAQEHLSESVPTCAAMVLQHHGIEMSPDRLAGILGTNDLSGTPGRRLHGLQAWGIRAHSPRELQHRRDGTRALNQRMSVGPHWLVYRWEEAWLRYLHAALRAGNPAILFVNLGRLTPAWRGLSQPHAVVLSGGDGRRAWIHDPSRSCGPIRVGLVTLMDALLPGEPLAVVLRPDRAAPAPGTEGAR